MELPCFGQNVSSDGWNDLRLVLIGLAIYHFSVFRLSESFYWGYVHALPDSFCAATKIVTDRASVRTQERRLRRDCCDEDRIGFQYAILWCSVNQERQTFSLGVNTISRSEDWIFRSEDWTNPLGTTCPAPACCCSYCTRCHAAFRGATKSYPLSGIVYLFIYQLFWT